MRRPVSAWTFALVLSLTACGGPEKAPSATSSSPARPAPAATGTQGHPPAPAPSAERLTTLPAALERARKENEPVLAVFYAPTWSPPCAALKRSLLDSPEFKAWAASHVVLLVLDFPKEADNERNDLARRYEIIGFPTLLVLDASGRQLGKIDGARDASSVIARANEIIDSPHPAPPAPSEPKPAAAPSPERPFLGLSLIDGDGRGPLTVDQVVADSPAAAVGIRSGDRILEIDNKPVKTVGDVETAVRGRSVGDKVLIRLSRDGFEKAMTVTLRARGASQPSTPKTPDPAPPPESVAGKELRSQDGSVSLVVPRAAEGWARRTEGLLGTELFAMGRPDGEQSATISVDLLPADYAATEEGAFERARRDHGTKGELIDLPAGRFLRIDMEWQWERQPRKTRRCLAFRAGRAYLVQLSAAAQRIQVHLPLFEEIVSLVRFPAETKPPEPRAPVEPAPKPPAPAPPTGTPGAGGTFVLVVGVNEYKDPKIPKLKLAEDDARAVYSFFATEEKSPTAADRVKILRGADATRLGILKAIREHLTAKATRAEDTVILYFAGHGFADAKETYLATADTELALLPETAIAGATLQQFWSEIRAGRKVLLTDACHSGGLAGLRGIAGVVRAPVAGEKKDEKPAPPGTSAITIAASGVNEVSAEDEDAGHGVFTTAVLNGLRGEADLDRDGHVTADELGKYLVRVVPPLAERAKGHQTPVVESSGSATIWLSR